MYKLKKYLKERLDPNQTGFVPGCSTGINIQLLIEKFKESKKKDGLCCIFIDFKSAYNTILRENLYKIIKNKKILEE